MKYQGFGRPSGQRVFHEENFVPGLFYFLWQMGKDNWAGYFQTVYSECDLQ